MKAGLPMKGIKFFSEKRKGGERLKCLRSNDFMWRSRILSPFSGVTLTSGKSKNRSGKTTTQTTERLGKTHQLARS